jgi:hypothetical protein
MKLRTKIFGNQLREVGVVAGAHKRSFQAARDANPEAIHWAIRIHAPTAKGTTNQVQQTIHLY